MDNLDFEGQTDDGRSSHVTTMIAIQPSGSARMDANTSSLNFRARSRSLTTSNLTSGDFPRFYLKRLKQLQPTDFQLSGIRGDGNVSLFTDFLVWMMYRVVPSTLVNVSLPENICVPSLKKFCDPGISDCIPISKIAYLPVISSAPSNPLVVAHALDMLQLTAASLHQPYTVINL
ncbi:uncharacterized protein LOC136037081 isoform X2 [Artemia franciscana]|uniref:uncharacterized protein LOC136037081 isoform X2 n=1 Tax=Artemia franciscana TaxID=6661 RepID=UPI0032DA4198